LKPLHTVVIGGASYTVYAGLLAMLANVAAAAVANLALRGSGARAVRTA
jgi:SSS family solute:Na+ symporter